MYTPCRIDRCGGDVFARQLCSKHYSRLLRNGDPLNPGRYEPGQSPMVFFRLFNRISDECIEWPLSQNGIGYGVVYIDGKRYATHRLSLEMYTGVTGQVAMHGPCHNRLCMNARGGHLSWGTLQDNQRDRLRDGTHQRGSRHPSATIDEDQALEIYRMKGVVTQRELAARFGVGRSVVEKIHSGEKWGWLTGARSAGPALSRSSWPSRS